MSSLGELTSEAAVLAKDPSNEAKTVLQKGINRGLEMLRKQMKKTKYVTRYRSFSFNNGQARYQLPEGAVRVSRIGYTRGGTFVALNRIDNKDEWDRFKGSVGQSGDPDSFFIIGADQFEVYPAPGNGATGSIEYQGRPKPMTADDVTAGTVNVTGGSQDVVGVGTSFAANMVGRFIKLASSSDRSDYYRIINVQDATHLTVENYFDGATASNVGYLIGECPDLPEEYHAGLVDYALYRFFKWRKDKDMADTYLGDFRVMYTEIGEDYSNDTTSSVIPSRRARTDDTMLPSYKRVPKAV